MTFPPVALCSSRKIGEYSIQRGRGIANGKDQGEETTGNLARAKEPLEIGVLNVRTLKAEYKQSELTYVSEKIRIDILCLDCARHDEEFKWLPETRES